MTPPATINPMTTETPPSTPLLELDQVSRQRGGRPAVADLSLSLERGDVLGMLGVNGAGKSTTLAMMVGALAPDRGAVRIDGQDLVEHPQIVRRQAGWLSEHAPLYVELTVTEHLDAIGRLHGLRGTALRERREKMLALLQLEPMAKRLLRQLSQGQRQRVGLACALLHDPPLLVLDEPANGLDPVQIEHWRELVRTLADDHAVVISTHALDEVTATCNRIAILHEGQLRHAGPVEDNTRELQQRFMAIATGKQEVAA
ncbi:MAG: ABC transporter ATP-binding protein [Rhodanobacteraceae bacterium]